MAEAEEAVPADPDVASAVPEPSAEVRRQLAELPGRLAVGHVNRLAVMSPDGSDVEWLDDNDEVTAAQAVWSGDGSLLAWSRTTVAEHELVVLDVATGEELVSVATGPSAFYLQWSADDSALAYMRNDANGRGIEFGFAIPGQDLQALVAAAPFYVSWAPTGSSLAAHVADTQVVVLLDLLEGPVAELEDPVVLLNPSGGFTAPVWVDGSTLLVASPAGLALLDVNSNRGATVVDAATPVRFVVSPDRLKVAYHVPGLEPGVSQVALGQVDAIGGLVVLDLPTGQSTLVTEETPVAWEWSPDSAMLAWLDAGFSALRPEATWNFWDGETTTTSEPYQISQRDRQSYLPFFEQYAQSHARWSPDGTAFAFAGTIGPGDDGQDSVWVQLVGVGAPPVRVADGDIVTWSS